MNMSQYSRSNKNQKPEEKADTRPSRGEKVKQGLSVFQTVVATIASLLGIIVTSFTIMSLLNKDNQKTEDKPSSSTSVVVVHDKGSDSSATNTDTNTNTQTNSSNTETSSQKKPIAHLLQKPVHLLHKTKAPQQQTVAQIQHHLEPTKKSVRTTLLIFFGFRLQLFLIFIESIYLVIILPFEL